MSFVTTARRQRESNFRPRLRRVAGHPVRSRLSVQSGSQPVQRGMQWFQLTITTLPSLAAVVALVFTYMSVQQTRVESLRQDQLAQSGQITDRFNAAITNIGSSIEDIRLGGIYALQRIMEDSSRDQPTVMAVLAAFIRDRSQPKAETTPTDVRAAASVLAQRFSAYDDGVTVDLDHAGLARTMLTGAAFEKADLSNANLTYANLTGAHLARAELSDAELANAVIERADLTDASISNADFTDAFLRSTDFEKADLSNANLTHAFLAKVNLANAELYQANFTNADLTEGANLTGADLTYADLTGARLSKANLTRAVLVGAHLTDTDLDGAILTGANLWGTALCMGQTPREPQRGYRCDYP